MLIVTISRLAGRFSYIYSFINKRAILIVLRHCNWSKKLQSTSFNASPVQDVSYTIKPKSSKKPGRSHDIIRTRRCQKREDFYWDERKYSSDFPSAQYWCFLILKVSISFSMSHKFYHPSNPFKAWQFKIL